MFDDLKRVGKQFVGKVRSVGQKLKQAKWKDHLVDIGKRLIVAVVTEFLKSLL